MLNELRNNFFIGEDVRHTEIFHFDEKSPSEISRPGNFINEREGHSKISRLQCRASGSNNSDKSTLHNFGGLADFDFESATPASDFSTFRVEISPHPSLSPPRAQSL